MERHRNSTHGHFSDKTMNENKKLFIHLRGGTSRRSNGISPETDPSTFPRCQEEAACQKVATEVGGKQGLCPNPPRPTASARPTGCNKSGDVARASVLRSCSAGHPKPQFGVTHTAGAAFGLGSHTLRAVFCCFGITPTPILLFGPAGFPFYYCFPFFLARFSPKKPFYG